MKMAQTLTGPNGIMLTLDKTEVNKEDPGMGTPAIVRLKGSTATYWCATGEGEVEGTELSDKQMAWLLEQEDAVDALYD
jgi:hypothetical protein